MELIAANLGCKLGNLPTQYLGMTLGAQIKDKVVWSKMVERFQKKLTTWKRQYLSKGGRLTLIKSTLSSMPTYTMSVFCMPNSISGKLEKLMRDFLWGGQGESFKYHLVKWEDVCKHGKEAGLGIRRLQRFNKALLGKSLWRFATKSESLWRRVIDGKYGHNWGNWETVAAKDRHGVGVWKGIMRIRGEFFNHVGYKVGNGKRVGFWGDKWAAGSTLCEVYPLLFNVASTKDATTTECWDFSVG